MAVLKHTSCKDRLSSSVENEEVLIARNWKNYDIVQAIAKLKSLLTKLNHLQYIPVGISSGQRCGWR